MKQSLQGRLPGVITPTTYTPAPTFPNQNLRKKVGMLGSAILLLIAWLAGIDTQSSASNTVRLQTTGDWVFLSAGVIWIITLIVVSRVDKRAQWRGQRRRDANAADLMEAVHSGERHYDFSLYLRTFAFTGQLPVQKRMGNTGIEYGDLETWLAKAFDGWCPFVGLGVPGEHLGAGRIQTDDDHWKELLSALCDAARVIFIIPSHRPGTLWEIEWLVSHNLLRKIIFVMPATQAFFRFENDWSKTQKAAFRYGLTLPQYRRHGLLFRLNDNGAKTVSRQLTVDNLTLMLPSNMPGN